MALVSVLLHRAWLHVVGAPQLPRWRVLAWALTAGVGAAGVIWSRTWAAIRNLVTFAHEGGHVVAGSLLGRRVRGVRLRRDTSGETMSVGVAGRPVRDAAVSFFGYPAPALCGLAIVDAVCGRHAAAALLTFGALMAITIVFVRNLWGLFVLAVGALAFAALVAEAPPGALDVMAMLLSALLTAGSLRTMVEHRRARVRDQLDPRDLGADVYGVSRRLHLPPAVVEAGWRLWWLACLVAEVVLVAGVHVPL